jgi:photosystem II stability/assembly factor-like uncharacterized protein
MSEADASLVFPEPSSGYLRAGAALTTTFDGGRTWHAAAVVPDDTLCVRAVGSVGWMIGSHGFSYTLDGGHRWSARRVEFPAPVVAFTVISAESGYVVAGHGLIYRYRVVPFEYAVPMMLTIPGMTTFLRGGS